MVPDWLNWVHDRLSFRLLPSLLCTLESGHSILGGLEYMHWDGRIGHFGRRGGSWGCIFGRFTIQLDLIHSLTYSLPPWIIKIQQS